MKEFTAYKSFEDFVFEQTGCKMYAAKGINFNKDKCTSILKSVEGTPFYSDNLIDPDFPEYTLSGKSGDQNEKENTVNRNLLDPNKTRKIYLFQRTKTKWIWYGRYYIHSKYEKFHPGEDGIDRKIIILRLSKKNVYSDHM